MPRTQKSLNKKNKTLLEDRMPKTIKTINKDHINKDRIKTMATAMATAGINSITETARDHRITEINASEYIYKNRRERLFGDVLVRRHIYFTLPHF